VMVAETISLGILSLPAALSTMGIIPGVTLIVMLGIMAMYTGFVIGDFKLAYPHVENFADALQIVCGKYGNVGRAFGWVFQETLLLFIIAAHILTFGVELNVLTNHASCTLAFTAIGAIVCFVFTLPRTFKGNRYISLFSCVSIATATIISTVSIGINQRGVGTAFVVLPNRLTEFGRVAVAVSNMILAFNGHIAYFAILDEMKEPRDFPKAVTMLGVISTTFYAIVAVLIYWFDGHSVPAPALNAAGRLVRKIAYGFATPTIVVAGVIPPTVAGKQISSKVRKKNKAVIEENSFRGWGSWILILVFIFTLAWLIASAVPVFNQLLALIGAAFGTWFALGFGAIFWFHMHQKSYYLNLVPENRGRMALALWNLLILTVCIAVVNEVQQVL
ncbi:MAG: hypothetical protein FE78DRAFT_135546, partial [Acidomyces sp. 'richmondensis']